MALPSRNKLLAKIKIGQKQLGMDDEQYRTMLSDRYGKRSAAKLTFNQMNDLVRHMTTLGAVYTNKGRPTSGPKRDYYEIPDGTLFRDQKRWIAQMWFALDWKMSGLDTRCRSQFGVEKFLWLNDQADLQTLARDLVGRCAKKGLDPDDLPEVR